MAQDRIAAAAQGLDFVRPYSAVWTIVEAVLRNWPEHRQYCLKRFTGDTPQFLARMDDVAKLALAIVGDEIDLYCQDYRWMCEEFTDEDVYFLRHKKYRLSTFADAYREVYGKAEYMSRYVRGILISQIIWKPHAQAFDFFRQHFLPSLPQGSSYLEIGPGHGLFLYFAASQPAIARLEAWDVSASSIAETRATLRKLGVTRDIAIVEQDVLVAPPRSNIFDGAIISEVLEHLEQPGKALTSLHAALKPGGRIFINAPINSPAPDHIYLWRTIEEFRAFVLAQGFAIDAFESFPVTGATLDEAVAKSLSISCVVIARKP